MSYTGCDQGGVTSNDLLYVSEADRLGTQRDALLAALRQVEWVDVGDRRDEPLPACPWCRRIEWNGHAPNCERQAAIAAAEEVASA